MQIKKFQPGVQSQTHPAGVGSMSMTSGVAFVKLYCLSLYLLLILLIGVLSLLFVLILHACRR